MGVGKSVVISCPAPKEQVFLTFRNLLHVIHRKVQSGRLELCAGSNDGLHCSPLWKLTEIQSSIRSCITEGKINLARHILGGQSSAVAPNVGDLIPGYRFSVRARYGSPTGAKEVNRGLLIGNIQVVGFTVSKPLENSNNCQYGSKERSPGSSSGEFHFWLFVHGVILFAINVASFILTITLAYNLRWMSNRQEALVLFLPILFTAAIWALTMGQFVSLILGGL